MTEKRPRGNPNFKKGVSGNPAGRPKGKGSPMLELRTKMMFLFQRYEKQFFKKLEERLQDDPIAFYHEFIIPFMPNKLEIESKVITERVIPSKQELLERLSTFEIKVKRSHAGSISKPKHTKKRLKK